MFDRKELEERRVFHNVTVIVREGSLTHWHWAEALIPRDLNGSQMKAAAVWEPVMSFLSLSIAPLPEMQDLLARDGVLLVRVLNSLGRPGPASAGDCFPRPLEGNRGHSVLQQQPDFTF